MCPYNQFHTIGWILYQPNVLYTCPQCHQFFFKAWIPIYSPQPFGTSLHVEFFYRAAYSTRIDFLQFESSNAWTWEVGSMRNARLLIVAVCSFKCTVVAASAPRRAFPLFLNWLFFHVHVIVESNLSMCSFCCCLPKYCSYIYAGISTKIGLWNTAGI